jgi:hypothetical protein
LAAAAARSCSRIIAGKAACFEDEYDGGVADHGILLALCASGALREPVRRAGDDED